MEAKKNCIYIAQLRPKTQKRLEAQQKTWLNEQARRLFFDIDFPTIFARPKTKQVHNLSALNQRQTSATEESHCWKLKVIASCLPVMAIQGMVA